MTELIRRALLQGGVVTLHEEWWRMSQKRAFDLFFGSLLLLLALPVMLCIAIWIKTVSRGPIFFKQERVGHGIIFTVYKFRSMHWGAGGPLDEIEANDKRIITGGELLRRTHIDELAQLFNVLMGDMSLVGPRPRVPEIDEQWVRDVPNYLDRYKMKTGLTGEAQLYGRSKTLTEKMEALTLDLAYISNWSLWRDFVILFKTAPKVLYGRGE